MRTQAEISRAVREGRVFRRSFNKNISIVTSAGVAHDLSMSSGNPPAQYYVGAIGTATALARSTDGGLDHGPNVSPSRKFLKEIVLQTVTAGAVPSTLSILDYLMFYPFNGMDAGTTELVNNIELPRYSATEGTQIMLVEQNPYVGAGQVRFQYTNQDGVEGRLTPIVTLNSVANIGTIASSAPTLAGAGGRFIPLQHGDYGVQKIDSIEIVVGDVGVLCAVVVKPIATFPLMEITAPNALDVWFHCGELPQIQDDAFLNFVMIPAGNATGATIYGDLITVWE